MADIAELKQHLWKKLADSPFVMAGLNDGKHSIPLTAQLDGPGAERSSSTIGSSRSSGSLTGAKAPPRIGSMLPTASAAEPCESL